MSFKPFLVGQGLPAWLLLKSNLATQKAVFSSNTVTKSDSDHFTTKFSELRSAEEIVSDRRVLRVVLGAYGLGADIDSQYFIKRILEEGVTDRLSLANKLSDRRYRALAADFDFTKSPPSHLTNAGTMQKVLGAFQDQSFETAIGETDNDIRMALSFKRSLADIAETSGTNTSAWYQILGTPPVRQVLETALGLPEEFGSLDIDDQHKRIIAKAEGAFSTSDASELASETVAEEIIQRFLVRQQVSSNVQTSRFQNALTLLVGA